MKQTIKNIGKALLGLVMTEKHQPLSKEWIEANKKELEKSVKNSAFRPPHFKKFNTTFKNEFKKDYPIAGVVYKTNSKQVKLDTRESIIQEYKEIYKDPNFKPKWGGFDNNIMEDLAKEISKNKLTTEQKLKDALEKLGSQPGYGKFEKSDKEYIKCDGTGTITHRDDIYYYAPSNLHLSKDFFINVTKKQLEDNFDIDNDDDFRAWVADKLLKVREF